MNRDSPGRPNIPRITLGDLTNQLGKRGFSLISRSPASKSAAGSAKHANKENGSQLIPQGANNSQLGVLKGGKTYRLLSRGNADSAVESNSIKSGNQLTSAEPSLGLLGSGNSQSVSKTSKHDLELKDDSQATQTEPLLETLGSQTASTDGMDNSGLNELHGAKPFELEQCVLLKADAVAGAGESLKSCSCSFCVKAANIWSELHYMDVKGRLSVLMKSKREAKNLARFYSLESGNGVVRGRESSSHSPLDVEIDLMNRSKSLFVCMEETFGKECHQLETEYSSLKEIRESLKMNLGTVGKMPQDAQHCASEAFPRSKKIT